MASIQCMTPGGKKKKPVLTRSFRLIDFHIYDESQVKDETGSGSDEDADAFRYKKKVKDDQAFVIQMFGINETGETCCLYVNDYLPFFFVKVADNWTNSTMNEFMRGIQSNKKLKE